MEKMKFYSEEEMLDKHVGKIGTPHRDQFEDEINTFLIGEAIKEARKNKNREEQKFKELVAEQQEIEIIRTPQIPINMFLNKKDSFKYNIKISKIENGKNLTLNTISRVLHAMGLQAHLNIPTVGQYAI